MLTYSQKEMFSLNKSKHGVAFIDKLPSEEDKVVLTKLIDRCYKYSVAINSYTQLHPFPSEALIMALLLEQHKLIEKLTALLNTYWRSVYWLYNLVSRITCHTGG